MGKTAKLEYLRRLVPLGLATLGLTGWAFFMSALSCLLCLAAALGIYAALPGSPAARGAIQPVSNPPVIVWDLIGFALGGFFLPLMIIGMVSATGALAAAALVCILPVAAALLCFTVAVRHETSWLRFFGNGFEFAQFGLRVRVPYSDLDRVQVKVWRAAGPVAWFQSTIGSSGRRKAVLLNGEAATKTLIFRRKDGMTFTVSSELIPDLQRLLIGMDRAEIDLPDGLSDGQRRKIRRRREQLYGTPRPEPKSEQLDVARIAALIEHARRNQN